MTCQYAEKAAIRCVAIANDPANVGVISVFMEKSVIDAYRCLAVSMERVTRRSSVTAIKDGTDYSARIVSANSILFPFKLFLLRKSIFPALCRDNCHPTRGYCEAPNECRCRLGWAGATCRDCQVLPGCQHGSCTKPLVRNRFICAFV